MLPILVLSALLAVAMAAVIILLVRLRAPRQATGSVESSDEDRLLQAVPRLMELVADSERSSARLSRNIQKALIYASDISTNAEGTLVTTQDLHRDVAEGSAAVEEIHASIETLAKHVLIQQEAIENTSRAMEEIDESLHNVSDIADRRLVDSENLVSVTSEGNAKVTETDKVIRTVSDKVQDVMELITVINEIAAQTDLLSMNAAIEAAHAGDAGRGFAVVAEEIRKLATSTAENSAVISKTLGELVDQIKEAGASSQASGEAFERIDTGVHKVTEAFQEINRLTSDITDRSREVVESTQSLKDIATQTSVSMDEMGTGAQEINTILGSSRDKADLLDRTMTNLRNEAKGINLITTKISSSYLKSNKTFATLSHEFARSAGFGNSRIQNRMGISNIILGHINWIATARAAMDGTVDTGDVSLTDSRNCTLGRWIDSHDAKESVNPKKLDQLQTVHEALHTSVESLISMVKMNRDNEARKEYEHLLEISQNVVQILTTIGYDDFISWDSSLSVNVALFDGHHKKLIGLINTLYVKMESGEGAEVLARTLAELIDYTDYHFTAEILAMEQHGYPEKDAHKKLHDELLKKARELHGEFSAGRSVLTNEVLDFLQDWVTNHILKIDKKYSEFFRGKDLKGS